MYAYAGKYRIEGETLVLDVDGSWNQAWTWTQRKEVAKIEGNPSIQPSKDPKSVAFAIALCEPGIFFPAGIFNGS